MIDYQTFSQIKDLSEQKKLNPQQISRYISIDPRTVNNWLEEKRFRPRKATVRESKLDPFKDSIIRMLESHPYTATQVFQRISEEGFTGKYTIVKKYVRKVRPVRTQASLTLAFAPGECAQVDWGSYGSIRVGETSRRLSFFVMVLCYSRQMYVEFTVSQTMEHFLDCHANAFAAFGGVPARIMVDNLKSAVLHHPFGQAPVFNPRYLEFAKHYGFDVTACNVRKPNEKGRVENAVGYVKKNFLDGNDLPDFRALAPAVKHWLTSIANTRIHASTHKRPVDMLAEEKPRLLPLPLNSCDIGNVVQVRASSQFRVAFESNRYSVPARFAGMRLTMKTYPAQIFLYHEAVLIAKHPRSYDRNQDIEDPDHPRELIAQRKRSLDQKLMLRFLSLSPRAVDYFQKLEDRHLNAMNHVRKILALADTYGSDAVVSAMDDADIFHAAGAEYIANILECRARKLPEPGPLHLTRRSDMLDIEIKGPDLSIYNNIKPAKITEEK